MSENKLVEEIKNRLSIEEVVSSYIKLEKTGINMKARCPFHNEKTASFFVSPDRGSFYCFGCSKGGDVFSFVEEIENVDFIGALKILADKAGVDVSKFKNSNSESSIEKNKKDLLYEILEKSTKYFEQKFQTNEIAKKYVLSRGLTHESIKKFRIGYSLDEWQSLYNYLKSFNYSDIDLVETGLFVKNDKGRIYDRFRGRIIFPIFDETGKIIAYSARILTDDKSQPKYINSPETQLFNKSKTLYGFNFAKQIIRKHDFAILTEGQMDVILTHQVGYSNSVASSGTSFTEDQLKLIKKYTNNLLISFDGDSAGINSSKKVWDLALESEMDVKVVQLPKGSDPASIILEDTEKWKDLVKNSKHIIIYLSEIIFSSFEDKRKRQKEVQLQIYPLLRSVKSYTDKSYFIETISETFGIDKDVIWADINKDSLIAIDKVKVEKKESINPKEVLFGIYNNKQLKNKEEFLELIKKQIHEDLILEMENKKDSIMFQTEVLLDQYKDLKKLAEDMLIKVSIQNLEQRKIQLNDLMLNMKEKPDEELKIINEMIEIKRSIEQIKKEGCHNLLNMI
jgi:DNA primase